MATLSIHLQEGFTGDTVLIDVNGKEVFHEEDVRTKLLLGYAAIIDVEVEQPPAQVTIELPEKELSSCIPVPIMGATYLGISLEDDEVSSMISQKPFGYG